MKEENKKILRHAAAHATHEAFKYAGGCMISLFAILASFGTFFAILIMLVL